jgi:hypothetical protein
VSDRRPEKTYRHQNVSASVWRNESPKRPFYNVTFQRSYQDGEETRYVTSFGAFDLWNVVRCCADAYLYIAMRMKEDRGEHQPAA